MNDCVVSWRTYRTSSEKLEATLNTVDADDYEVVDTVWTGGRDWVVTAKRVMSAQSGVSVDYSNSLGLFSSGEANCQGAGMVPNEKGQSEYIGYGAMHGSVENAVTVHGLTVGTYSPSRQQVPGSGYRKLSYSGWVEDDAQTWILFLDPQGRPSELYLDREIDGAVIGDPIIYA